MIALLVITDGRRDCIARTIPSAMENIIGHLWPRVIYDDSGNPDHREWLADTFARYGFVVCWHDEGRQGFGGAIAEAWRRLDRMPADAFRYVVHLEDDFTFNRPVPLGAMVNTLDAHPELVQLALRRQPWNAAEVAAGGVVELHPESFREVIGGHGAWLQHRMFWTTNPSLFRRSLLARGWPTGPQSEGRFSIDLFSDPDVWAAYWGTRASTAWVNHIGDQRVGTGY